MSTGRHCLSIVTAVLPTAADHLAATARSVATARSAIARAGWNTTWVVVIDGPGPLPQLDWPEETTVRSLPVHAGTSTARNRALRECRPGWVLPLDADDLLDADGLVEVLTDTQALNDAGWIAFNRVLADGRRTPHWIAAPRRWTSGQLEEQWTAPFPFHPNSLLARRDLVLAAGGWPAVTVNEDLGLCLRISSLADGAAVTATVIRYRAWEGQSLSAPWYEEAKAEAFSYLGAVLNAQRALRGKPPARIPSPGPGYGTQTVAD